MQKSISYIPHYLFLILTATLIFSTAMIPRGILNTIYILTFASYFIDYFINKRWTQFTFDKTSIVFVLMIALFIASALYPPFGHYQYYQPLIEKRLPLLAFGIIGLLGVNQQFKLTHFLYTIIITAVAVPLWNLFFNVGIDNFNTNLPAIFTLERIELINAHMGFNLYLNIALASIWYICYSSWNKTSIPHRSALITAFVIIYLTLLISEGRSGFLAANIILFGIVIKFIYDRKYKKTAITALLIVPIALGTIASQHPRISKESISNEMRICYWKSSCELISERPIYGYGISQAQEQLDTVIFDHVDSERKPRMQQIRSQVPFIDSHNQFIQITLEFGFIGLIIALFIYFIPLYAVHKKRIIFASTICFLFVFQSIFDMFITGAFSMLFGVIWLITLKTKE